MKYINQKYCVVSILLRHILSYKIMYNKTPLILQSTKTKYEKKNQLTLCLKI